MIGLQLLHEPPLMSLRPGQFLAANASTMSFLCDGLHPLEIQLGQLCIGSSSIHPACA